MQYFLEKCRNNYFTDQHMLFPPPVLMENKPGGVLFFSLTGLLICPRRKTFECVCPAGYVMFIIFRKVSDSASWFLP